MTAAPVARHHAFSTRILLVHPVNSVRGSDSLLSALAEEVAFKGEKCAVAAGPVVTQKLTDTGLNQFPAPNVC